MPRVEDGQPYDGAMPSWHPGDVRPGCAVSGRVEGAGEAGDGLYEIASVALPGGELRIMQPAEGAELPDAGAVEWAPLVPYWMVLWRSGVALAREVAALEIAGARVLEIGCGLGAPSLAAARGGAEVLASDAEPEALALLERNASRNGVTLETVRAGWADAGPLLRRVPFDLVLAADVLYERAGVGRLLSLLPELADDVLLADPGRPSAEAFLAEAPRLWSIDSRQRGVVGVHRLTRHARLKRP